MKIENSPDREDYYIFPMCPCGIINAATYFFQVTMFKYEPSLTSSEKIRTKKYCTFYS